MPPALPSSVADLPELKQALKAAVPGMPFDPSMVESILSGKLDVDELAKQGAIQLANLAVPGLGVALSAAMPYIEKAGAAIADVLTGAKAKRDRRRRNWNGIRGVFNRLMDEKPMLIYSAGKQVPSDDFVKAFRKRLTTPSAWVDSGYYRPGNEKIPYWITSASALKRDYEGSGLPGKRTGVSYLAKASQPAELVKMLDRYYQQPGKTELRDRAIESTVKLVKAKADQLRQQANRRPTVPKKKNVVRTAANAQAVATASKQKKPEAFRAARSFTRKNGPYLDTVVQIPMGENQWLNLTSRVDTRAIASRIAGQPVIAGCLAGDAENVCEAVRKVAKATAADRALAAGELALEDSAIGRLVPRKREVKKQLRLARRLAKIKLQSRRGDKGASRVDDRVKKAATLPGAALLRSADQLAERAYIIHVRPLVGR